MVKIDDITKYIDNIPPLKDTLKKALDLVHIGDLVKAAEVTSLDMALVNHFRDIVEKPIYGFKGGKVQDIKQIFLILGIAEVEAILGSYLVSELKPKEWIVFKLTDNVFLNLQIRLMKQWENILEYKKMITNENNDIAMTAVFIPFSIIISDELFRDYKEDIKLLKEVKHIDYNTILHRITDKTFFGIAVDVARKWEISETTLRILELADGKSNIQDATKDEIICAKYLHLLFFYELSRPESMSSGLNDFIEFNTEFVKDIQEDFQNILNIKGD